MLERLETPPSFSISFHVVVTNATAACVVSSSIVTPRHYKGEEAMQ